jgi:guanylate kinase
MPYKDTTRNPRAGELDGVAYNFVSRDSFLKSIEEGAFIEYATFSGNMYGTTFRAVKDVSDHGKRCILDIDAQVCSLPILLIGD